MRGFAETATGTTGVPATPLAAGLPAVLVAAPAGVTRLTRPAPRPWRRSLHEEPGPSRTAT